MGSFLINFSQIIFIQNKKKIVKIELNRAEYRKRKTKRIRLFEEKKKRGGGA